MEHSLHPIRHLPVNHDQTPPGDGTQDPGAQDPGALDAWARALDLPADAPTSPVDPAIAADRAVARRIALLPRHAVPAGVWSTLAHAHARLRARQRASTVRWAAAAALAGVLCGASVRGLLDTEPDGGWPALAGMTATPATGTGSDARLSEDLAIAYGLDND